MDGGGGVQIYGGIEDEGGRAGEAFAAATEAAVAAATSGGTTTSQLVTPLLETGSESTVLVCACIKV